MIDCYAGERNLVQVILNLPLPTGRLVSESHRWHTWLFRMDNW